MRTPMENNTIKIEDVHTTLTSYFDKEKVKDLSDLKIYEGWTLVSNRDVSGKILYHNGVYLGTNESFLLYYSYDLKNWTICENNNNNGNGTYEFTFFNNIWLAFGYGWNDNLEASTGLIEYSYDGINWKSAYQPMVESTNYASHVAQSNNSIIVYDAYNQNYIVSNDGINWYNQEISLGGTDLDNGNTYFQMPPVFGDNKWAALTQTGIYTSTDGKNWTYVTENPWGSAVWEVSLYYVGGRWYIAEFMDYYTVYTSTDLTSWEQVLVEDTYFSPYTGALPIVSHQNHYFINDTDNWCILHSSDGVHFYYDFDLEPWAKVAIINDKLLFGLQGGVPLYCYDNEVWQSISNTIALNPYYNIIQHDNKIYVSGEERDSGFSYIYVLDINTLEVLEAGACSISLYNLQSVNNQLISTNPLGVCMQRSLQDLIDNIQ